MNVRSLDVVRSEALWERVVTAMRRAIVMGELVPGSHLKEPVLAQRFGVSRLPIREAIARLEREGLVRIAPRRGAFVLGVTEQDISDIYECRLMLESHAIRRAAGRIDEQGTASLQAFIDQMDAAVVSGQLQFMAASDMAFHRLIIVVSGNRAVLNAWEPLAPLIEAILGIADANCPDLPVAVDGHRSITRALEQHDADAAEALLHEHLAGGENLVHNAIRSVRNRGA